jgi:clan AA aspartic protease
MGHDWEGNMGRVSVSAKLSNNADALRARSGELPAEQVRQVTVQGIADTGAAMCVISEELANQLGLPTNAEVNVRYADSRTARRRIVEQLEVEIMGRRSTFRAVVEPNRAEPLIGVIVLEDLDLLVDPRNQTLSPRDPAIQTFEIE